MGINPRIKKKKIDSQPTLSPYKRTSLSVKLLTYFHQVATVWQDLIYFLNEYNILCDRYNKLLLNFRLFYLRCALIKSFSLTNASYCICGKLSPTFTWYASLT